LDDNARDYKIVVAGVDNALEHPLERLQTSRAITFF
jgi:hypothetical protein